jgi:hypothetical protein
LRRRRGSALRCLCRCASDGSRRLSGDRSMHRRNHDRRNLARDGGACGSRERRSETRRDRARCAGLRHSGVRAGLRCDSGTGRRRRGDRSGLLHRCRRRSRRHSRTVLRRRGCGLSNGLRRRLCGRRRIPHRVSRRHGCRALAEPLARSLTGPGTGVDVPDDSEPLFGLGKAGEVAHVKTETFAIVFEPAAHEEAEALQLWRIRMRKRHRRCRRAEIDDELLCDCSSLRATGLWCTTSGHAL